jgi:hypothetical protein
VPDGVCVVWTGFLPEPLEVVCGRPRLTIVVTCGDQGAPHVRATHIPILSIVVTSHCHGPLKALLAPLFATLDALPAAVGGDIGRRSLATAQGHLPASLGSTRHDCIIASGMLGGDALVQAPCTVLGMLTRAPLVSLAVGLSLNVPALLPQRGLEQEICRGQWCQYCR